MTLAPSSLYRSSRPVARLVAIVSSLLGDGARADGHRGRGHRRRQGGRRLADDVGYAPRIAFDRADPLEIALDPNVDQAKQKNDNKNEHFEKCEDPAAL